MMHNLRQPIIFMLHSAMTTHFDKSKIMHIVSASTVGYHWIGIIAY